MDRILDKQYLITVLLFVFFTVSISYSFSFSDEGINYVIGAEYGRIAESIVKGNGYANVFAEGSGPTAWMLPLNTGLFVLIFYIFGINTLAALLALTVINSLFWSLSGLFLLKVTGHTRFRPYSFLVIPIFLVIIFFNPNRSIGDTMDVAFVNFLSIFSVYVLYRFIFHTKEYVSLFVLAVVLPLSSPGLFLAFAVVVAAYFFFKLTTVLKAKRVSHPLSMVYRSRKLAICICVGLTSLVILSGWGIRNYIVLNKVVLSKSNLWYEFYQANVADDDGILDRRMLLLYHPYSYGHFFDHYMKLGEVKFTEHFKQLSITSFDATDYLKRVWNRLSFSFLYSPNTTFYENIEVAKTLSANDVQQLESKALVLDKEWISLNLEKADFLNAIHPLKLEDKDLVIKDWFLHRLQYKQSKNRLITILRTALAPILLSISILGGLIIPTIRKSAIFRISLLIYVSLLLPYILVSISHRYIFFTQSLQCIFLFFIVGHVLSTTRRFAPVKIKNKISRWSQAPIVNQEME